MCSKTKWVDENRGRIMKISNIFNVFALKATFIGPLFTDQLRCRSSPLWKCMLFTSGVCLPRQLLFLHKGPFQHTEHTNIIQSYLHVIASKSRHSRPFYSSLSVPFLSSRSVPKEGHIDAKSSSGPSGRGVPTWIVHSAVPSLQWSV